MVDNRGYSAHTQISLAHTLELDYDALGPRQVLKIARPFFDN